jgi:ribosomal protein S6--L-glutamate ligase
MRDMEEAGTIYYPSSLYEDFFLSLGKKVFPRNYYRFMGNKIRQTNLFQLLDIRHPRTRLYYGRNPLAQILADFRLPFIGKTSLGSSKGKGVFLIKEEAQLENYLRTHRPAYIQEYLPVDRDLRVVVLAGKAVHAYWRIQRPGEFRNNVFQGATISFADIPPEAVEFAEDVARRCRFDEVGLDICVFEGECYAIEANMVFGLEGFKQAGLDLPEVFADLERHGLL